MVEIEAEAPECPVALIYLWNWFGEISLGLSVNGMSVPTVTWESLVSWCVLRNVAIERWESLALVRLGQLRASVLSQKAAKSNPSGGKD